MLSRNGEEHKYPSLVPDLRRHSVFHWSMMLTIGTFYQDKEIPFYPYLGESYCEWMLAFVKCSFRVYGDDHVFFLSLILIWSITLIDLWMLSQPSIPGINPTQSVQSFLYVAGCDRLIFCKKFYISVHKGYWL